MQQTPRLGKVEFNFTKPQSKLPAFLSLEEDKVLVKVESPFEDPGGLYTIEEITGAEQSFLKEWSIISGTPPEARGVYFWWGLLLFLTI